MHDRRWEYKVETVKPGMFSSGENKRNLFKTDLLVWELKAGN